MNWVSLILQVFAIRRGLQESRSMAETAKHYADRGKRAVAATMAAVFAGLFFFSGLLVAVIDLGLQIDRSEGVHYSGLMISATILFALGLLIVGGAYLLGRSEVRRDPPPREATGPRTERVKDLLEEFLGSFLQQLLKPGERRAPGPKDPPGKL